MTNLPGTTEVRASTQSGKTQFRRVILLMTVIPLAIFALIFVIAVIVSLSNVQGAAEAVRMLRDLMLIFIALELALIFISLSLVLVQVARLVNLLTEEVAPILETTQETVQAAQNTVEFAGQNVLGPFIDLAGFLMGALSLVGSLFGLRRAYRRATRAKRDENAA